MTKVRNLTRTLGAVAALVGLVVGVPAALALGIGWPLPREVPSLDALGQALSGSSISDGTIMGILAAVLWVAWFAFVCVRGPRGGSGAAGPAGPHPSGWDLRPLGGRLDDACFLLRGRSPGVG